MRITIDHTLTLAAPMGPGQAVFHLLLTPPSGPSQTVESWSVDMAGIDTAGRFTDGFGNAAQLVNQPRPEGDIVIRVRGVVVTRDTNGVLGRPPGEPVPALYRRVTEVSKVASDLYEPLRGAEGTRLDLLHALMQRVGEALELHQNEKAALQTQMQADGAQVQAQSATKPETDDPVERPGPAEYAHLFIGAARALDIPARFVTGYLVSEGAEPAELHAWAEAFDDGLGWIGFDPHAQICPTDRYVRLAVGLDAASAAPLRTVPVAEITQKLVLEAES